MNQAPVGSPVQWRSRTTFVLALSAAAVGLGSLWRFSWLLGQYGGGAFMLSYIAWLFLLAVPLLCAELILGYWGRGSPVLAIRNVCDRSLLSRHWQWLGLLACLSGLLIAGYQAVVAGWSLYFVELMSGDTLSAASAPVVAARFSELLADGWLQLKWQSLFLAVVFGVLALGVRRGLGVLVWLAVPVMMTLLGILVQFALDHGNLAAARDYLFSFKLVDFSPRVQLVAMGHALFTLGVGVGAGLVYGAYAPRRIPIGRSVMAVAVFDTVVALLAGIAIFPVIFAHNLAPAQGPALLFISLPYAFANAPQGELFGVLFFGLTVVVSLGFAAALTEPAVRLLQQQLRLRRLTAVAIIGGLVWLLAWIVAGSVAASASSGGPSLLQSLDFLSAHILLPLVCLGSALLVGWGVQKSVLRPQLGRESDASFSLWHAFLRYIAPPAIVLVMVADVVW